MLHNSVTVTFDFLSSESAYVEVLPLSMCTEFGVDSSSRFSFTAWTHTGTQTLKVTHVTDHLTHASAIPPAWHG